MNLFGSDEVIVIAMIFAFVFMLLQAFILPAFGENRQVKRRMRQRLEGLRAEASASSGSRLLQREHLRKLTAFERRLESLPGMDALEGLIERAGTRTPGYRLVLLGLALLAAGTGAAFWLLQNPISALLIGAAAAAAPFIRLRILAAKRQLQFEEQLPEALLIMIRSLRAGHPLSGAMHMVAEDMPDPIGQEFGVMFAEINYGGEAKDALLGLLERMPTVPVMAFVSSILIQQETGGNLAELLDKLAAVIRSRFRFQRHVRTLTAQGRLAAWILSLLPFVLAGVLAVTSPEYLPMLTKDPTGRQLIVAFFVMMICGVFWISRVVRIDV
jgi:tight adherence protein B